MRTLGRTLMGLMTALWLYAAAVQYDDPDPVLWTAVYLFAAVLSVLAIFDIGSLSVSIVFAAVCLLWSGWIAKDLVEWHSLIDSEEGREMLGLFFVALWMGVLIAIRARPPAVGGRG